MSTNQNLYSEFEKQLVLHAGKTLLIDQDDVSYSYSDVDVESARLANYLSEQGVNIGDRVSVQAGKSPQALCLYLACLRAGFVFHPLNPAYTPSELEYFLQNAEPSMLVCDPGKLEELQALANAVGITKVDTLDNTGRGSLVDQSRGSADTFTTVVRAENDLAALLYSSGTTGVPKGIMLSHQNLTANTEALIKVWGFTDQDRLLHALPIFHVHGLFVAFGCVALSGASMRWLPSFDSTSAIQYLPECTVMMGVPTYYTRLLDDAAFIAQVGGALRLYVSGSAPLLEETFHAFEQRTGHRILERYGMTETNMNTSNPLEGERKAGTVGPPLPNVEIRITDDSNQSLADGEIGNLQVKGPNVFQGYWRLPDKTAEDFTEDGFFNTGDKGRIDEDGYVSIVGRTKDVVITGGLNVYPKEVELLIDDIDGVKESAVIGIPHADFGEAVVAVIVLLPNAKLEEADVISIAKQKLANFKVPKKVVFVDDLPRNAMGKVQKNELRKVYS